MLFRLTGPTRVDEDRIRGGHLGRAEGPFLEGMPMATDSMLAARLEEQDMRVPENKGKSKHVSLVVVLPVRT